MEIGSLADLSHETTEHHDPREDPRPAQLVGPVCPRHGRASMHESTPDWRARQAPFRRGFSPRW
jgi:hypothetical protein